MSDRPGCYAYKLSVMAEGRWSESGGVSEGESGGVKDEENISFWLLPSCFFPGTSSLFNIRY